MPRRTILKLTGAALVLALVAGALYLKSHLRPSGDLSRFGDYHVSDQGQPGNGTVKVTFLGTTTLLLDDGTTRLMVDAFLTRPPLLDVLIGGVATDRARVDSILRLLAVDTLHAIFTAHSHYDHVMDVGYVAHRTHATLYGSRSTRNLGRGAGIRDSARLRLYAPGQEVRIGKFGVTAHRTGHSPQNRLIRFPGEIERPRTQPLWVGRYREGGSYDFVIRHGDTNTILVKPSAALDSGALQRIEASVVFLGVGTLGRQDAAYRNGYYDETVGAVRPKRVIPIHWDDIYAPLSDTLPAGIRLIDDTPLVFDWLAKRTAADSICFQVLQGYQSVLLFAADGPDAPDRGVAGNQPCRRAGQARAAPRPTAARPGPG